LGVPLGKGPWSAPVDAGVLGAKGDTVRADLERVARIRTLAGVTVKSLTAVA